MCLVFFIYILFICFYVLWEFPRGFSFYELCFVKQKNWCWWNSYYQLKTALPDCACLPTGNLSLLKLHQLPLTDRRTGSSCKESLSQEGMDKTEMMMKVIKNRERFLHHKSQREVSERNRVKLKRCCLRGLLLISDSVAHLSSLQWVDAPGF